MWVRFEVLTTGVVGNSAGLHNESRVEEIINGIVQSKWEAYLRKMRIQFIAPNKRTKKFFESCIGSQTLKNSRLISLLQIDVSKFTCDLRFIIGGVLPGLQPRIIHPLNWNLWTIQWSMVNSCTFSPTQDLWSRYIWSLSLRLGWPWRKPSVRMRHRSKTYPLFRCHPIN